jgi:hypothetical protein
VHARRHDQADKTQTPKEKEKKETTRNEIKEYTKGRGKRLQGNKILPMNIRDHLDHLLLPFSNLVFDVL